MKAICRNLEQIHWDTFVHTRPEACFSHLYGWSEGLGLTSDLPVFGLALKRDGRPAGILPLVLFSAPGQDKRLVSLPYTDASGIIADDGNAATDLLKAAWELAAILGAPHLELRQAGKGSYRYHAWDETIIHKGHSFKTGLARDLPSSSEELWKGLDPKVRNQVRKARKCGCRTEVGGAELLADFYRVFSENMRDLGSAVHDPRLFQEMIREVAARIFVVYIEDTAAAASIAFLKGTTLYNPWASSLRRFRPRCPNMILYWSMLAFAAENGCRRFDFGRSSPDASTCRFKMQWGARMEPLVWHVFSHRGFQWDPRLESLVDEEWKGLDLDESRRKGPAVRRWISL